MDPWEAYLKPSGKVWGTRQCVGQPLGCLLSWSNPGPLASGSISQLLGWGHPKTSPDLASKELESVLTPRGGRFASGPAMLTHAGVLSWEATWPGGRLCRQSPEKSQSRRLEAGERMGGGASFPVPSELALFFPLGVKLSSSSLFLLFLTTC